MLMNELEFFRMVKDSFFAHAVDSPLTPKQREKFAALEYYAEAPELIFDAELRTGVEQTEVTMQTSSGSEQVYRVAGTVLIEIEGCLVELTLYQVEDGGDLFLPFRDATSGKETYGGGRYLEARPPHDDRVRIDFNYAYNPYCAYNDMSSCPLPPPENWLSIPIRAGEKSFPAL